MRHLSPLTSHLSPLTPSDLHWQREKVRHIQAALNSDPVDISALRQHACSLGGLVRKNVKFLLQKENLSSTFLQVHAHVRKKAWPKLAGVNMYDIKPYSGPPLPSHKDRAQVQLDVNRCTKRIPKGEGPSEMTGRSSRTCLMQAPLPCCFCTV